MFAKSMAAASSVLLYATLSLTPAWADATNIVLVHGMNADGSVWRPVYDILEDKGYKVTIVQMPLTGYDNDVAATRRIIDWQDGPTVLVAHSYGGMVITEAGNDEQVGALVYVAALQPELGDSMGSLNASMPSKFDGSTSKVSEDGYVITGTDVFIRDVAGDLPEAEARFLSESQTPTTTSVFGAEISAAAWKDKPTFAIVATQDRTVNPDLQRWMYDRSGSKTTEVEASHMVLLSQPKAVADVIIAAAQAVD